LQKWHLELRDQACRGARKNIYLSFPSEAEGDAYVAQLEALVDAGQVPREFTPAGKFKIIRDAAREYLRRAHLSNADMDVLPTVIHLVGRTELKRLDCTWADEWILNDLKRKRFLSTSTIRHYVGALARCLDWAFTRGWLYHPNPLRDLPRKYATYSINDQAFLPPGKDMGSGERDRRLERGEHECILAVFDSREFNLGQNESNRDALRCIYLLAISTGMRLSEIFTLQRTQIDLEKRTIFLDRTKNGRKRQVPLFPAARAALTDYLPKAGSEYLFPSGAELAYPNDGTPAAGSHTR
jgi:integrase